MVSVGLYSETPNIPVFEGRDQFQGEIIHVSALKSRDQLTGKRVVVVGYGKSATDAAVEIRGRCYTDVISFFAMPIGPFRASSSESCRSNGAC